MPFTRWVGLVLNPFVTILGGTPLAFSVWGDPLGNFHGYTDGQKQVVGFLLNLGAMSPTVGGFLLDKYGPTLTCLISCVLSFVGYFSLYLIDTPDAILPSHWLMASLYAFIAGQGSSWMVFVALRNVAGSFPPKYAGQVIGGTMSFFGAAAAIFLNIYYGFFGGKDPRKLLLIFAVSTPFGGILSALCPLDTPPKDGELPDKERHLEKRLLYLCAIAAVVAIYNAVTGFMSGYNIISSGGLQYVAIGMILIILTVPFLLIGCPITRQQKDDEVSLITAGQDEDEGKPSLKDGSATFLQAISTASFWLMYTPFMCIIGMGLGLVNNLAPFVASRQVGLIEGTIVTKWPNTTAFSSALTLFSSMNGLATMLAGLLSDKMSAVPRELWVFALCSWMAMWTFITSFSTLSGLAVCGLGLGLGQGAIFSQMPALMIEYFGLASFGSIYSLMWTAPAMGILFMATLLVPMMSAQYTDKHFIKFQDSTNAVTTYCYGLGCYSMPLLICSALGIVGSGLAAMLYIRRRKASSYSSDLNGDKL